MKEQAQFPDLPPTVEPAGLAAPLKGKPRLLRANRQQGQWQVTHLDGLLAEQHPARAVWAFVEKLDLSDYTAAVQAVEGHAGHPAIDPAILLGLWLFATSEGVSSARELERLTEEHDAYRWLCGGVSVNYHTLSDFRSQGEKLDALLTRSLAVLMQQGLLKLERVSQDGMRVRASAGAASFRRRESLANHLAEARAQVERLKQADTSGLSARQEKARERAAREREERVLKALELLPEAEATLKRGKNKQPAEARTSTTDPEARVMKMADGGFRPAYNAQVVCDTQTRLIVGVEASPVGSDMAQLEPMLDQLEERFGKLPKEVLADGGYASQGSIDDAQSRGVTLFAPVQKPKNPDRDRHLPRSTDSPAQAAWRQRMGTEEAKNIFKERGQTVEWVNACLRQLGLSCFLLRGQKKVRSVLILAALTHNLFRARALSQAVAGA